MKSQPAVVSILNRNRATFLCSHAIVADTFFRRLIGMLGSAPLPHGSGLLIRPSGGVHTCGMRYPIDILALDKNARVLGAWSHTPPWRVRGISLKTCSVLELPSGTIRMTQTAIEDQLQIHIVDEPDRF